MESPYIGIPSLKNDYIIKRAVTYLVVEAFDFAFGVLDWRPVVVEVQTFVETD